MPAAPRRTALFSPLTLGLWSLLDPSPILSARAIVRGIAALRELRLREDAGRFDREHVHLRTDAVWGIAIGSGRVLVLALIGTFIAVEAPTYAVTASHPRLARDERSEIRANLRSEDDDTRALAARHLLASPRYTDAQLGELASELERPFPAPHGPAPHIPSVIVRKLRADWFVMRLSTIERLYPTLDPAGRSAALGLVLIHAQRSYPDNFDGVPAFWRLIAMERTPHPDLRLPVVELRTVFKRHPWQLAELLRLKPESPFASDVMRVAAGLSCQDEPWAIPDGIHSRAIGRAITRWQGLRSRLALPPEVPGIRGHIARQTLADEAIAAQQVLSCGDPERLASAREALEVSDPRVALAGLRRLRAAGEDVPPETIMRLAGEELVAPELADLLHQPSLPAYGTRELVRAQVVRELAEREQFATTSITSRRVPPVRPFVRVFYRNRMRVTEEPRIDVFAAYGVDRRGRAAAVTVLVETFVEPDAHGRPPPRMEILHRPYDAALVERTLERWAFRRGRS